jgi:hypothetical protein
MGGKNVETADPRQYLRLLLMRLLETQACLRKLLNSTSASAILRDQYQTNEYTLLEIRSWLEEQDETSPLGPSASTAPSAATSGDGSSAKPSDPEPPSSGSSKNPFVWRTYEPTEPRGSSQVRSSLPSAVTLPDSAEIIRGRIVFRPPSSTEKPKTQSSGGGPDDKDKG